jgi:branched-chain amino acid aminotransferase
VGFDEWRAGAASGRIRESFACGTAAVITPIGTVRFPDGEFLVADGGPGEVTEALRQQLSDIQRGRAEDPFGWVHRVI